MIVVFGINVEMMPQLMHMRWRKSVRYIIRIFFRLSILIRLWHTAIHKCNFSRMHSVVYRYVVARCLYVALSHASILSKRLNIKIIIKLFSTSGCHTIQAFPYQTSWQYSDRYTLTGRRIQGAWINRSFRPITSNNTISRLCIIRES